MILLFPLSRFVVGSTIGATAAVVPLSIGAAPFVARIVEGALLEVDHGLIEAVKVWELVIQQLFLRLCCQNVIQH